jgi:hypothetical protein
MIKFGPTVQRIAQARWIVLLLVCTMAVTASFAPWQDVTMLLARASMDDQAQGMMSAGTDQDAQAPCCDDCPEKLSGGCKDTALCMAKCGKLPMRLSAPPLPEGIQIAQWVPPAPMRVLPELAPLPLRRPPRTV